MICFIFSWFFPLFSWFFPFLHGFSHFSWVQIFSHFFMIFFSHFFHGLGKVWFFFIFTAFLLGQSRSAHLFGMFFRYQLPYLLVWCMRNIISGGSETRVIGRNTRWKRTTYVSDWDNKKNFKNHIIGSIITPKDSLSVKIRK